MYITHYVRVTVDPRAVAPDATPEQRGRMAGYIAEDIKAPASVDGFYAAGAYLADGTAVSLDTQHPVETMETLAEVAEGLRGDLAKMLRPDVLRAAAAVGPDSGAGELRSRGLELIERAQALQTLRACGTVDAFDPFLHTLGDRRLDEEGLSDYTGDIDGGETWLVSLEVHV